MTGLINSIVQYYNVNFSIYRLTYRKRNINMFRFRWTTCIHTHAYNLSIFTGTYAGQFAMEGFLNLQWARWIMVLVTRSLALIPTLFVAIFTRIEELTLMNDLMNVINCLQLPFAVIPLIAFTSNRQTMGENFVNCW